MKSARVTSTASMIVWMTPVLLLFACVPQALAHAILLHSTPADGARVHGHTTEIVLDYNSRIDARRSTLTLTGPGGVTHAVRMEPGAGPAELKALATGLTHGAYRVHWQVLADDGHITRGDIAFTVGTNE